MNWQDMMAKKLITKGVGFEIGIESKRAYTPKNKGIIKRPTYSIDFGQQFKSKKMNK